MPRILLAVSGIGMGHIARARVLAKVLMEHGASVDIIAPPPTGRYLEAYSMKPHPVSDLLKPYSTIVDRFYSATGRGTISFKMELEEARVASRNARVLNDNVDIERYDIIVSDESWELMYINLKRINVPKVLVTDFIYYPYTKGPLAALAFNRFISKRLRFFDALAFVGFPRKLCTPRWPPLLGENLLDATRIISTPGPVPPALEDELLGRREALKLIGLDEAPILAMPGGTRAGADIVSAVARILVSSGFRVATTLDDAPPGARTIPARLKYKIPLLIKAFTAAVTMAGLSTLSSLISTGVPALVYPLPGHFEQEENADIASRSYPWILRLKPQNIVKAHTLISKLVDNTWKGDYSLFYSPHKLARLILSLPDTVAPGDG